MTPTEHGSCDKTFLQLHAAFFFPILPTILNYGGGDALKLVSSFREFTCQC